MKEYLVSPEEVLKEQNSSPEGLSQAEAEKKTGTNRSQQIKGGKERFPAEKIPERTGGSHVLLF